MILLTGATGYVGSHTWVELLQREFDVVGIDNFSNSSEKVLGRISAITGKELNFTRLDVLDIDGLVRLFSKYKISYVIHFAALKSVSESVTKPIEYYDNNVNGLLQLLKVMVMFRCMHFIFSSSAAVYGVPEHLPISENCRVSGINPYSQTKIIGEQILKDMEKAYKDFRFICLRYFNPIGAHHSGLIGEDPKGIPNNIMPFISQVALGRQPFLNIYGGDWGTSDGSGVRDYIHVVDLAIGHISALNYLKTQRQSLIVNLGTGRGYSVFDLVRSFEKASGKLIPYKVVGRRVGDVAECYADVSQSMKLLKWKAEFDLDRMCLDSWKWQSMNPNGYL